MKYFFRLLLVAVIAFVGVLAYNTIVFGSQQPKPRHLSVPNFEEAIALAHLSGAVQCATNSYNDHVDTAAFRQLHTLIDSIFPLCGARMTRRVVNGYSLLYKWQGSSTTLKPVILLAHLDVVPVEGASLQAWTHAPYAGEQVGGFLWGRGTLDDKMSAFGLLEAAEMLLKKGFQPERTVYFAFGHDEEVGGNNGAKAMAQLLAADSVHAEAVLDEGMVVLQDALKGLQPPLGLIGIAEKGYSSLLLTVHQNGGHSSMPPNETAIGTLSKAIVALETHPLATRFSLPVQALFDYAGPEMDFPFRTVMANRWLTERIIAQQLLLKPTTAALLRTTTAPTIFQSGVKDNVLPREATATINFRILPGETVADVLTHARTVINDTLVRISVVGHGTEPSRVSDIHAAAFRALGAAIRGSFAGAVVAPALVLGGTDSHHYVASPPMFTVFRLLYSLTVT